MPEHSSLVRLLQDMRVFRGVGPADLARVARAAQYHEMESGFCFFQQGSSADRVYVLHQGCVKLTQSTADGLQVLLRFLGPGEMFGAMAAADCGPYPFSAHAVHWCHALLWTATDMIGLMESCPRIALNAMNDLSARLRELLTRYRELATERVEQRVAQVLLRLANQAGWMTNGGLLIDVPLSRQELAEMSGTTLYSVSRILSAWKRNGLVDTGRQRVAILQLQGLEAIADAPEKALAADNRS